MPWPTECHHSVRPFVPICCFPLLGPLRWGDAGDPLGPLASPTLFDDPRWVLREFGVFRSEDGQAVYVLAHAQVPARKRQHSQARPRDRPRRSQEGGRDSLAADMNQALIGDCEELLTVELLHGV